MECKVRVCDRRSMAGNLLLIRLNISDRNASIRLMKTRTENNQNIRTHAQKNQIASTNETLFANAHRYHYPESAVLRNS